MEGVLGLAEAIAEAVMNAAQNDKEKGSIRPGVIQGGCVVIGTASYCYDLAVDVNLFDGAQVKCQLTADGARAVIVGV